MIRKGQTAIEFVIVVAIVLFFTLAFIGAIQINISDKLRESRNNAVKEAALNVQDEINLASRASDGYFREFDVPDKLINGIDYEIKVVGEVVFVKTSDEKNAIALPVANVTGNVQKGKNKIRKENGGIFLNANP